MSLSHSALSFAPRLKLLPTESCAKTCPPLSLSKTTLTGTSASKLSYGTTHCLLKLCFNLSPQIPPCMLIQRIPLPTDPLPCHQISFSMPFPLPFLPPPHLTATAGPSSGSATAAPSFPAARLKDPLTDPKINPKAALYILTIKLSPQILTLKISQTSGF